MRGLLEGPVYTRPRAWRDREVPEVLLGQPRRDRALAPGYGPAPYRARTAPTSSGP